MTVDTKKYSPGVFKLLHHLDYLQKIVKGEPVAPIHVSIWPTSTCQLHCPYCCGRNITDKGKELGLEEFKSAVDVLYKYGTKAIELSGVVGEPLLWKYLDEGVDYAYQKGIKISLITNGLALKDVSKETLKKFSWIRVSLQSVNHAKMIQWNDIPTKINASYMVYNESSLKNTSKLYDFAKENNIVVRIAVARPCSVEWEDKVEKVIDFFDDYLFFAKKELGQPSGCYAAYFRAGIDWNGYFLPCPSIELNEENVGTIPSDFRLCHISELENWILSNPPHDLGFRCNYCNCGKQENEFIHDLLDDINDIDFV